MGVIGLNSFVENFYASCTKKISDIKTRAPVDYIYFDMNSVLHEAVRVNGIQLHEVNESAEIEFCQKLVGHVDFVLKNILQTFVPLKSVSVVFDGPVNMAKIYQQQIRRIKQKTGEQCITPGYWLMPLVENEILSLASKSIAEITRNYKKKGASSEVSIVLDGMRSPGEGEIKIARALHRNIAHDRENASHLIVGTDSDLIMVGMGALQGFNVSLFNTVSMKVLCLGSLLRSCWVKCFDNESQCLSQSLCDQRKISKTSVFFPQMICVRLDFLFLFMLSGNDYLSSVDGFNPTNMWVLYKEFLRRETRDGKQFNMAQKPSSEIQSLFILISKQTKENKIKGGNIRLRTRNINAFFRFALRRSSSGNSKSYFNKCLKAENLAHEQKTKAFVTNYFNGILWCLSTILKGECPDDHFVPSRYVPNINEIISCTDSENMESIEIFQNSNKGPFLPIVHFHLVVQAPSLLERHIKKYKKEQESDNFRIAPSTQLSFSSYENFSINNAPNNDALFSKAEHYLTLLEKNWQASGKNRDFLDRMSSYLLRFGNIPKKLPLLQFYFDQAKQWNVKNILKCSSSGNLPLPSIVSQGLQAQSCDQLKKVIELKFHSIIGISSQFTLLVEKSTWDNVESFYSQKSTTKIPSKTHRKRPVIDMDLPV